MIKILTCIGFSLFATALFAQTLTIRLTETNKAPVVGATVRLTDRNDTTRIVFAITDTTGTARWNLLSAGQYQLRAEAMGLKPLSKGIRMGGSALSFNYSMAPDEKALAGVTITARKPLMRQEEDKTIVDPEPIANTSTSAYEIIEKTPGLFVDQDGNVYLSSATPAQIYINGREQRMSAADIAGILKSLPPGSIERLEILRTPSAKYDASSSGGIVNVVLKKGVKIGRTGSVSGGFNQGRFGNQFINVNLNNSDGGRTSNLNFGYSQRNGYDQIQTTRLLNNGNSLLQDAYTVQPGQSVFAGYALGFEPAANWEVNFDGRANYNMSQSESVNESIIRLSDQTITADNFNNLDNNNRSLFLSQGFQTTYKIDSSGSEWTTNVAYNYTDADNRQDFDIDFVVPASTALLRGEGDINSQRHFLTAQTDLKYRFKSKVVFETGVKTAIQSFRNSTAYDAIVNEVRSPDAFRTNTFRYDDYIHAAYAQASKPFGAFLLKAGVRAENTNMQGQQRIPSDTSFRINRTDLFPYVYLSRPIMKLANFPIKGFLIHRRTITRPGYDFLNPFPRFLDQYLYEAGNPALRPQFTNNFEFNISMEDFPILAVGRNYVQDIFTNVIYQDPRLPDIAYRTYDNLGKSRETYFRMVGAVPPGGKYFFVVSAQYSHNRYEGIYENKPLTFSRGSWTLFTYHQLKLDQRSTLSLNGFVRLNGQQQFYELGPFGNVNLNINRLFLNRKLTVTLSVNDVFYTNRNDFSISQGNITAFGRRQADTRRVSLNARYNFGLKKREEQNGNPLDLNGPE